jgi:predicted Ser/Thr protein kinase
MPIHTFEKIIDNLTAERIFRQIPFEQFIVELSGSGELILRSIFQFFHDMIDHHISETVDEYPEDVENIGYLLYNMDSLFIDDSEKPFFADRLFSNRLVNLARSFRLGSPPHKIYVFKGPAGSGKSTFLNNLLNKLEAYARSDKGLLYEVVWKIPTDGLSKPSGRKTRGSTKAGVTKDGEQSFEKTDLDFFEVPCPNHDNPIVMIPRNHRAKLLKEIIPQEAFRKRLFKHKQFEWVLKSEPCTICSSIFDALTEKFSIKEIFSMIHARRYLFNRKQGVGISVFNSGDDLEKSLVRKNETIQKFLNEFFQDSNKVQYLYSSYAQTNQGVRALMDLKARNIQRFLDLHGIISDEVHKVQEIEERIQSLFIVLMNPGDFDQISQNKETQADGKIDTSLQDRIHEILVPYVLDYNTEIKIYTNTFGEQIKLRFMPHVLESFARVIISSRIKRSEVIKDWIKLRSVYEKFCDPDFHILKMDLYAGVIPEWLTKEDRGALKAEIRKGVLAESETEGHTGFSGRESQQIFNEFYTQFSKKRPITMKHLHDFFLDENRKLKDKIPGEFLKHLTGLYDHEVLKEAKDAIYSYNEEEIIKSILNYLVSITHNVGEIVKNPYLNNEEFEVTGDFLDIVETHLIGYNASNYQKSKFRDEAIAEYASMTLAREIKTEGKKITETKQFQEMFAQFTRTAREKVLEPYVGNNNFRCAIKEFDTEDFSKYDNKIKEKVQTLFKNLGEKYGYSIECAKTVILYVLDNNLMEKFK